MQGSACSVPAPGRQRPEAGTSREREALRDGAAAPDRPWYRHYQESAPLHERYRRWFRERFAHRFPEHEREDVIASVLEKVLFRKLPSATPRHDSNLDAYVARAIEMGVRDAIRQRYGSYSPPLRLRRLGKAYEEIYWKLYFQDVPRHEIAASVGLERAEAEALIGWLVANDKGPHRPRFESLEELEAETARSSPAMLDPAPDPGERAAERELGALLRVVLGLPPAPDTAADGARASALAGELALSDDEALLLRMRYVEGLTQTEVARLERIDRRTVKSREQRLLERLQSLFERHGFDAAP